MTPVFPFFLNDFSLLWTCLYVIDPLLFIFVISTTVFSFCLQVKYSKVFLRDTTLISPLSMLLFGGDIDVHHRERLISLDGWINFQVREHFVCVSCFSGFQLLTCFALITSVAGALRHQKLVGQTVRLLLSQFTLFQFLPGSSQNRRDIQTPSQADGLPPGEEIGQP